MTHFLDTDICIAIIRGKSAAIQKRLQSLRPGDVGMSVIVYLELAHGAEKSDRPIENMEAAEALQQVIPAIPLDAEVAREYGRIRAQLERAGTIIGPHDLLIAAHALTLDLILVTNNTREFQRVRGLRLENWTK